MDAFDEILGTAPVSRDLPPTTGVVPTVVGGERAMGGYEAADRFNASLRQWAPLIQSADADLLPDKDIIDARTRDMQRNDAYIQGGANIHKDSIVGAQYMLNTRPSSRLIFGAQDDMWEEEFQTEVEELWDIAADSPDNWIDAQRANTFTSMVRMAVGVHLAAGEVLATAEWVRDSSRPFSTAVQLIDVDRLSDPMIVDPMQRNNVRAGIRYDNYGAPQSYFIRTEHPADIYTNLSRPGLPQWKEVPIRKPWGRLQVIHIHEQVRPDQSRGVSDIASALVEMKFTKHFRQIQLQRAVMQSLYAAAITSEMDTSEIFHALGSGGSITVEGAQEAVTSFATGYFNAIDEFAGAARNLRLDGARIPHLYPGTKLEMLTPSNGASIGQDFEQSLLRYIAASIGVSYEQLSRDYTNTNYSSARAALAETWKFMQARKKLIADRFASLIFRLWLEEMINKNLITTFPARKGRLLYTNDRLNLKFDAISRCDWVGASRGQIDELKETEAAVLRIQQGLSTREEELARLGKDFRKVFRQLKREDTMAKAYGLTFGTTTTTTQAKQAAQ